jgi:hypothetical protein
LRLSRKTLRPFAATDRLWAPDAAWEARASGFDIAVNCQLTPVS